MNVIKVFFLFLGISVFLLSCKDETEQRKKELKDEIIKTFKERGELKIQFFRNSDLITEQKHLINEMRTANRNADVSKNELVLNGLEEKNKKLEAKLLIVQRRWNILKGKYAVLEKK